MNKRYTWAAALVLGTAAAVRIFSAQAPAQPQGPQLNRAVQPYVKVNAPVVALTHANVIDGTGAPARADQTLILRDGNIAELASFASVKVPDGATVIDLTGKSVMPGLVMLHEHTYYPMGSGVYGQLGASFVRLYLAGGVTTMRTAGNTNGLMDIVLKQKIDRGELAGPAMDATGPYLEGPNTQLQMHALTDAVDARKQVDYWADMGATSFKAYMNITRAELGAAIDESHKRGFKLTGHLCSVTLSEAADLGIDNIEHAFMAATDFVNNKEADKCPGQSVGQQTIAALDPQGEPFKQLVKKLVDKHVALTSTLTVFETFTPGRPMPPGLDVLVPELKTQFEAAYQRVSQSTTSGYKALFPKGMTLEHEFAKAGGMLVAGTDPTGSGGVIPGYSDQRQIELLVESGFTPLEAIRICTLNGAKYLGRDARIGTIAVGKQADLMIVSGDPSTTIADVRRVDTVFRLGIGYDPAKLIASVAGKVGLW
jgi:imidazolonepropionase-like amidohydrolase